MQNPLPSPAATPPAAHVIPLLRFDVVPHWGWRARHDAYTFEIERMCAEHSSERYRAFVRMKGATMPIASRPFGTRIRAKAFLQAELSKLLGGP